ncbi:lysozyme-like protein [Thelephora ganbajun]|uniref:Lysozyme-like protein n=1 Tax=Thelephora ganbajun TaxID=370292 RepID=A0ACB6ZW32_THEGA|nr:lysozyme-like protein [Thelephora ganbajun]
MKFLSTFVILAALSVFAEAASLQHNHVHRSNHNGVSRRAKNTGRCKQRPVNQSSSSKSDPSPTSTTTDVPKNTDQPKNDQPKDDQPKNDQPKNDQPKNDQPKSDQPPTNDPAPNTSGLITVQDYRCGPNGATQQVTQTTGPNGSIDWLNCGVESDGWNPPFLHVSDLVTVDLDGAIAQGGPFTACTPYIWAFKQFGGEFGLPPILLASIALQESTCNPGTVGGAGEQGLMQLTRDKCGDAPGGNCQDVGYNVRTGAKYFSDQLAANGGNFLMTLGGYNGWVKGMNVDYATRMRWSFCRAQNNLDYLFQTVNGWLLGKNAYSMHLGKYFNLDVC